MQKSIHVINGEKIETVQVSPGTTPGKVLAGLGLPEQFLLAKRGGMPLAHDEDLYGSVADGEKVLVTSPAVVGQGNWLTDLFFEESKSAQTSLGMKAPRSQSQVPLWKEDGWKKNASGHLVGYYRTWAGAFRGFIRRPHSNSREFYIIDPPAELLSGPHGLCFVERGRGRYFVHWECEPKSIDDGILRMEFTLAEAMKCA